MRVKSPQITCSAVGNREVLASSGRSSNTTGRKSTRGQQRAQGLRNVSRAEQQRPLTDRQRQGDVSRCHGKARGPQGLGNILRQTAGSDGFLIQQRRGGAVLRQHQPPGGVLLQQSQGPAGGVVPQGILRRNELEMGL